MLIDICPLRDELDVLELRLCELDTLADRFLVVQSRETHAGTPKPLALCLDDERWHPWRGRLDTLILPTLSPDVSRWQREQATRQAIVPVLAGCADDDLVLMSDVDEVPDADAVREAMPLTAQALWIGFVTSAYYYYLNLRVPALWRGIALARVDVVRQLGAQTIRDRRTRPPVLCRGGWHFSYLGGVEAIQKKLAAFAHEECDTPTYRDAAHIAHRIAERRDLFDIKRSGHGDFRQVGLGELPRCVQADPDRWRAYLLPEAVA